MARTTLAVQQISLTGLTPAFTAANADGHSVDNAGNNVFIYVKNGGGSPITVTVPTPGKAHGVDFADDPVTVTNGSEKAIGRFQSTPFDQDGGVIHVDFSAVTSVTVAALKL